MNSLRLGLLAMTLLPVALTAQERGTADVVFRGGPVYTLNQTQPWAEAVAVSGDEILAVGTEAEIDGLVGPETVTVELDGRLLLPGFIDTHIHIPDSLPFVFSAELTPAMTAEEALAEIARYAAAHPEQSPVVGSGFLAKAFGPNGPTAAQLDTAVADRPAIMIDEGGHTAWVNSAAMAAVNLTRDTLDPVPGSHFYQRYPDGTPTGWLVEQGAFGPVVDALGVISRERLERAADAFLPLMSSMGITAAFDAGTIDTGEMGMDLLYDRAEAGTLPLRIVGSYYVNKPAQLPEAVHTVQRLNARYHSEFYDLNTLKISLDGTVEAATAVTLAPYREPEGHRASPLVPQAETLEAVLAAGANNMNLHIHALGDGAVRMGLDMVAALRRQVPESESRVTLCHIQVVNPDDVARFADLGVVAQSTPAWFEFDTFAQQALGDERFRQMYPLKSIAEAGARVTLGSDFPATWIGENGLSPLYNIEMAVTRQRAGDPDFAIQPKVTERISVADAVRGYTLDAAYQIEREERLGSIEPGKQADLVVLDRNILEADPYTIHATRVDMTMVNGSVVFERSAGD